MQGRVEHTMSCGTLAKLAEVQGTQRTRLQLLKCFLLFLQRTVRLVQLHLQAGDLLLHPPDTDR